MANHLTPEYSNELLRFVNEVYTQDIAHYYPKLRLEKLIDLLEHAEYLFESYRNALKAKQRDEMLTAFVVGCFYIYLIIPRSIQFHSRDKSYAIYADLKKYYQDETHMTNVLLMVTGVIESMSKDELETAKIVRKRAYSVPHRDLADKFGSLALSSKGSAASSNADHDNDSTMWTAPDLEPNDHLKVNLGSFSSSATLGAIGEQSSSKGHSSSSDDSDPFNSATNLDSRGRRGSAPVNALPKQEQDLTGKKDSIYAQNVNRYETHRKDSCHSVHMLNEEYDSFTFNLARLQKQSIIGCDQLFKILASKERDELLVVDLRFSKRYQANHVVAPNLINIDPRCLWDVEKNGPVESVTQIARLLDSELFNRRFTFKRIIYYTDMKTYMRLDFDYQLLFFQLIYTSSKPLNCVPEVLLGGYEQWKRFITKISQNKTVHKEAFFFRPTSSQVTRESQALSSFTNRPLPVPSNPPPPLPVPDRGSVLSAPGNRAPFPLPTDQGSRLNSHLAKRPSPNHAHGDFHASVTPKYHTDYSNEAVHVAVPTIEESSDEYVSLSITGLRNVGNTCYINTMVQCLFATSAFRELFLSSRYEKYLSKNSTNQKKLSSYFHLLFKKMYMNGGCSVVPTGFLKACDSLRPDLKIPYDQQDTQEFLLFLLSQLHDELSESNQVANDYPDLLLHDDEQLDVDRKEYDKWFENHVSKNGVSPIDEIFQGQIENALYCQRCGHSSYNYSVFYVLSLAIPSMSSTFGQKKKVRLEDCINLFTGDEQLTNENAWDCPKCGSAASGLGPEEDKRKKRFTLAADSRGGSGGRSRFFKLRSKSRSRSESPFRKHSAQISNPKDWRQKKLTTIKTINFISLPSVLTIHLSRFFYDLTKKNNKVITYPLTLSIVLKNSEVVNYRLFAIANHFGNLISGHYTSLVNKDLLHELRKGEQKWYYFDDEVVKKDINHGDIDAGITSVSSSDVYVLFYERIQG
ncbi:LANO_0H24828g1_1 [Lachancea nothofagi CBS 11611]|uniref:ubiquitinyl hydrolase 1 n=1 Tax=Lachancea nothofagi CBS 11611 TaxID=1266666 RepID=A0A1G4KP09_9SACH|nr:LANO_0H24828g1_1 [Lachancea nothofagi CBS 11611]